MISLLLAFTPSFIHVFLRRLMGQSIGKGSRIRFGTVIRTKDLRVGNNTTIGPLVYISADKFHIGTGSSVRGPTYMSCAEIELGNNVRISSMVIVRSDKRKTSTLSVGHCSSIFPLCWIEPGEGVVIEEQVGIGGFSLIFTHSAWPSYLKGGPWFRAPVRIGANTHLPWKVFVLPGVDIGRDCIIGAGALVNKSVPDNSLAAGVPAKVLRTPAFESVDLEGMRKRLGEILQDFANTYGGTFQGDELRHDDKLFRMSDRKDARSLKIFVDDITIDLIDYTVSTPNLGKAAKLTDFLRDYGIRLNPKSF